MNFLSVKNITKNYVLDSKNLEVLKGTNLSIKQHESVYYTKNIKDDPRNR